jgi:hypothetical protein
VLLYNFDQGGVRVLEWSKHGFGGVAIRFLEVEMHMEMDACMIQYLVFEFFFEIIPHIFIVINSTW